MLATGAELQRRFDEKLATDTAFAANPQERLLWFYSQTPCFDNRYLVYPVARIPFE